MSRSLSRAYLDSAAAAANEWTRPADWLAMPATAANQIDILAAVFDHEQNHVALSCTVATGTYDVDWGDGTSDIAITSAATVEHLYTYADPDLAGTESAENGGYKQALVKITPSDGSGNITAFDVAKTHSVLTAQNDYTHPWLDIQINAAACTSMVYSVSGAVSARLLERVNIVAIGNVTSLFGAFRNLNSLQSIMFPAGSLVGVTSLDSLFSGCTSLQSVTFPAGSLASVTGMANAFQNCNSLQSVTFPSGSLANVTTTINAFLGCTSLANITNCLIPVTFSVAACSLSSAALDEIYTSLPTVTAETITVSTNFGIAADNPAIATGKGWTVVG